jgi:hypothetical protein
MKEKWRQSRRPAMQLIAAIEQFIANPYQLIETLF